MQSQPDADTYHAFMQNLVRSLRFLRDDVPLVVTNTDTPNIHDTLVGCLRNQYLDSVYFSAPYISEYFVNVLKQTPVKSVFVMVDKDPTDYVKKAMTELLNLRQSHRIEINVVQRPPKSSFLHQKLLVPLYRQGGYGLYPPCAFAGSVNFTANGIKRNDEALIVLRNQQAIIKCLFIIFERAIESQNVTDI